MPMTKRGKAMLEYFFSEGKSTYGRGQQIFTTYGRSQQIFTAYG